MMPYDWMFSTERYEERVREAEQGHLAARVARTDRQPELRDLLRGFISCLIALAPNAGIPALRGRRA